MFTAHFTTHSVLKTGSKKLARKYFAFSAFSELERDGIFFRDDHFKTAELQRQINKPIKSWKQTVTNQKPRVIDHML